MIAYINEISKHLLRDKWRERGNKCREKDRINESINEINLAQINF
jgi:hypothetical protein